MPDLTNKVAIVSGGATLIGWKTGQALRGSGAKVVLAERDRIEVGKAVAAYWQSHGAKTHAHVLFELIGVLESVEVVNQSMLEQLLAANPELPHFAETGGETFKIAAAWLIEQCGFKQRQADPVRVHPDHALVIINPERRPAAEIRAFAADIMEAVESRFGIRLEQEPRNYG